jgi:hypothetical protein
MELSPDALSDALAELTVRYQELSDRREVTSLLDRYAAAIDAKDFAALDRVFTPDAHLDYSSVGGEKGPFPEVRDWLARVLAGVPLLHHYVSNVIVALDGDQATTRCNLFNPMGAPEGDGVFVRVVGGRYHDRHVRTPDGWRIADRRLEHLWSAPLGTATFAAPGMLGGAPGSIA